MPPSALQRKILERYKQFREEPPNAWRLLKMSVIQHALLIMGVGAVVATVIAADMPFMGVFGAGMGFGALARDFGAFRLTARVWPAIRTVIDWQKVDQVLAGEIEVDASATHH